MTTRRETPASMSSASSQRVLTPPSSTASVLDHSSTLSSGFEAHPEADLVMGNLSPTSSATPRFTPSSTSSAGSQDPEDPDPDVPLPSVESYTTESRSTPSTARYTPSQSPGSHTAAHAGGNDSVFQGIGNIRDLRLNSQDAGSIPSRATRTPSIHVTPSAPPNDTSQSRSSREDSITVGLAALRVDSQQSDSQSATRLGETSSPTPARRRRSGSGIRREQHQIEAEEPPEAFTHMAEVQEALIDAQALTRRIATALGGSILHLENGSSIQSLHQQATRLAEFQPLSSRTVGLVGDSGVGKSSLINSLLDMNDLARASASGAACTCAVTEYHFHERNDFVVHVDYFSLEELKTQFEELLRAHRDFHLLPARRGSGTEDDVTENERLIMQRKAELAMQTFRTSFGARLIEIPELLSSTPFEQAVAMMVEWASQLVPQQAQRNTFSILEDCAAWLRTLSSETDSSSRTGSGRTSWPFMQKVRVYLKAYILSKGLVIADLPGLRDLNSARQNITERYVRKCHQVFVVARIDRAITDESIKQIFELARRVNLSKVDIVCTRSEDIQTREAIHDWPNERVTIEDLQSNIASATNEIETLKEEIDEYDQDAANLTHAEERQFSDLQREYRKVVAAKKTHELELKRFIIRLRNDNVSRRLRREYRTHPIAASLRIFCVSNNVYWDNREKAKDVALPYLRLSGILELRRYCIGLVAQSRHRAIQVFIKDQVPALIGSIDLWVEAGSGNASAESKQRILDTVSAVQRELDKWHHSSYKAFCSHYGDHSTPAIGSRCWNEEAIEGMATELSGVWDSFAVDIDTEVERANTAVMSVFAKVLERALSPAANRSPSANVDAGFAMRNLVSNLVHREDLTSYGIEQVMEIFGSNLASLRADTLSSVRTASIGKHMERTYHAANMEFGSGSHRRRVNLITGRFGSSALFEAHRRESGDEFRRIARELQEKMVEVVNEQVELIANDLQVLRDGNAISENERDVGFKRRVCEEMRSVREEIARLGRLVEDA
ncbi:hypothetical protein BKA63DRAFT_492539 [Paraphoma chrysanthemicola]|nr:hypothetical protein BKA63DRAFT_492539 [Paraphoma chrysanthemicola]